MKKNNKFIIILIALITLITGVFFVGFAIGSIYEESNHPNFSIPEEYKMIDKSTAIQGHYNPETNTLHIEFDNSIQFVWEGLERDIPKDGVQQLHLSTNENTIYLNPVDE